MINVHIEDISQIIEEKFNLKVAQIKFIGEGYDSRVYLVNNNFIFKFAKHDDSRASYQREKKILDFLQKNFASPIQIPQIAYFSAEGILGYREIKGSFLTKEIYSKMSSHQQKKLIEDISAFLTNLHELDTSSINEFIQDAQESFTSDLDLLKENIFPILAKKEQSYIEDFINHIINEKELFNVPMCLCHNDLSANHILLDDELNLTGIIDFGDAIVSQDFCDFTYLLEDSEEEIGSSFGESILNQCHYKNIPKALEYAKLIDAYYPIETIVCGIENKDKKLLEKGLLLLKNKINNN